MGFNFALEVSVIQVSDVNKNIKNPSTDVFCSLSIRAAVMSCPESELSAQALPSSLVATQPNTSSEAKTKKTFGFAHETGHTSLRTLAKVTMIRWSYQGALRGSTWLTADATKTAFVVTNVTIRLRRG